MLRMRPFRFPDVHERFTPPENQEVPDPFVLLEARKAQVYALADLWEAYGLFEDEEQKRNRFLRVLFENHKVGRIDFCLVLRDMYKQSPGAKRITKGTVYQREKIGSQLYEYQRNNKGNYPARHKELGLVPYMN